ncbi:MAG: inositol monophosphatase family protein [Acidobacteria bacterium]|nr:inositol monophosphatase family protein [Acidobacteriota bacterium]
MTHSLMDTAVAAARAGAEQLVERFRRGDLQVRAKAQHDFVSEADEASERAILALIGKRHPEHAVLSEEEGVVGGNDRRHVWVVDPLDGTTNFLQGLPIWGVAVACVRDGEVVAGVVYDPLNDQLFAAEKGSGARWDGKPMAVSSRPSLAGGFVATGYPFKARAALDQYLAAFKAVFARAKAIRRCGAAVLDLAYTAAGVYDGFFEFRLAPWDLAAGTLLIEEAGGRATDLDGGRRFLAQGNLIAGSPAVQAEILELVSQHADEATLDAIAPNAALEGLDMLGSPVDHG